MTTKEITWLPNDIDRTAEAIERLAKENLEIAERFSARVDAGKATHKETREMTRQYDRNVRSMRHKKAELRDMANKLAASDCQQEASTKAN